MPEEIRLTEINLVCPINTLGYGIVGLNILKALSEKVKVAYWPIGQIEVPPEYKDCILTSRENTNFFNHKSPSLRIYHQNDMALHASSKLRTGFPIFELNSFQPIEKNHLQSLDYIFVASEWAKNIIQEQIKDSKVSVVEFGVDTNIFLPKPEVKIKTSSTIFLNIGKWEIRKGHDILVDAFNKAFTSKDDVILVMNCNNPFLDKNTTEAWHKRYLTSPLGDKIRILSDRLATQTDVANLMNSVDAGVFPSRAEGWNLELLEMMACGKPVIATNYSAHTQFVNKDNANLINIKQLEPAFDGIWFYGDGEWASIGDEEIEQLVEYMRSIHKAKQTGENLYNSAGIETANKLNWNATASKLIGVLSNEINKS